MAEASPGDGLIAELFVQAERTAARLVGRDQAEDIASETLIRALSRWPRISESPHAWVTTVAANLAIDVLRKRRPGLGGLTPGVQPSFETDTVRRIVMVESLRRLPRRQRQVVVLHYLAGFTDAEVSHTLGLSPPTVKTHLSRAMTTLRRLDSADMEETNASTDSA